MSKPVEPRYPSGPAKVGEQKSGGGNNPQPFFKANPVSQQDHPQGPGKAVQQPAQKSPKNVSPAPLRAAKGDDDAMSKEPRKS